MRGLDEMVAPRRYTEPQVRLIVTSPADGSQDFYVSAMVGMPLPMVAMERKRLASVLRGKGVARWSR